jgi:DNA replication protein DnaC
MLIGKKMIDELYTLRFVHNGENLILLGPPGIGETHIAIDLGIKSNAWFSVYFINSVFMISRLKEADQKGYV